MAAPLSRSAATSEGTALEGESPQKGMEGDLVEINFKVNGHLQKLEVDPRVTLLEPERSLSGSLRTESN